MLITKKIIDEMGSPQATDEGGELLWISIFQEDW